MKTAISIPNHIFEKAEKLSKRLKMSRSELYSKAVNKFIEENKATDITKILNEVYKDNNSSVDKALYKMQLSGLDKEDW
jgi:metal-responsive CopG/Arc/MetJ family transcriptional regulator